MMVEQFSRVIECRRCTNQTDRHLLRDERENLPQPGYVGKNYYQSRVLLVGQNPGTPKTLAARDNAYTAALRAMKANPCEDSYAALAKLLDEYIPQWPVHGKYFPLEECALTLDDIAYCNIVRCRTSNDKAPGRNTLEACVRLHFANWLNFLAPQVVIFVGKWAEKHGAIAVQQAGIPFATMNRQRSLSSVARSANRTHVVTLVSRLLADRPESTVR